MKRLVISAVMTGLLAMFTHAASPATTPATSPTSRAGKPLAHGDSTRTVQVGDKTRSYLVHVPPSYDPNKPTPVVLAYHGAFTNGAIMAAFCGLNKKADSNGFIAVYPNGSGKGPVLFFNAFGVPVSEYMGDDITFTVKLLDDLAGAANVDPKRVYATGMSNGAMMCHRVAVELADRIAAAAPVAGTLCIPKCNPSRPVPVLHIHGSDDKYVPYEGMGPRSPRTYPFKSVDTTIEMWVSADACPKEPRVTVLPDKAKDGTVITRSVYGPGKDGAEVILYSIQGGGHTWPGQPCFMTSLGKTSMNINANDIIWDFFCKHPMK